VCVCVCCVRALQGRPEGITLDVCPAPTCVCFHFEVSFCSDYCNRKSRKVQDLVYYNAIGHLIDSWAAEGREAKKTFCQQWEIVSVSPCRPDRYSLRSRANSITLHKDTRRRDIPLKDIRLKDMPLKGMLLKGMLLRGIHREHRDSYRQLHSRRKEMYRLLRLLRRYLCPVLHPNQ
jgi:hypothetical protein